MKNNKHLNYMRSIGLILAILAFQTANAQTTSLSLKEAIDFAEKNSPGYLNSETDVQIAEQTVKTIKSAGLPQVNASAGYMDYLQIPGSYVKNFIGGPPEYLFFRFQQKYSASGTLAMNQLLFDGTYFLGLKAATDYVALTQTMVAKSRTDLHMNVAKAYLLALTTAKNIDLINGNLTVLEKSLKEVSALYDEGFAEKIDMQRLQLAVSNLRLQKQKLENAVTITQNLLKFQIGMDVNTVLTLTDDLETLNSSIPLAEATSNTFNVQNRVELKRTAPRRESWRATAACCFFI
jgi:outer membrane protein